jgi:hypothetical protein
VYSIPAGPVRKKDPSALLLDVNPHFSVIRWTFKL